MFVKFSVFPARSYIFYTHFYTFSPTYSIEYIFLNFLISSLLPSFVFLLLFPSFLCLPSFLPSFLCLLLFISSLSDTSEFPPLLYHCTSLCFLINLSSPLFLPLPLLVPLSCSFHDVYAFVSLFAASFILHIGSHL